MGTSSFKCFVDNKKNKNRKSDTLGDIKGSNGGNLIKDDQNHDEDKNKKKVIKEMNLKLKSSKKKTTQKNSKNQKLLKESQLKTKKIL